MTAMSLTRQVIRLKLLVWRYRGRRAVLRLIRRLLDWMEPTD